MRNALRAANLDWGYEWRCERSLEISDIVSVGLVYSDFDFPAEQAENLLPVNYMRSSKKQVIAEILSEMKKNCLESNKIEISYFGERNLADLLNSAFVLIENSGLHGLNIIADPYSIDFLEDYRDMRDCYKMFISRRPLTPPSIFWDHEGLRGEVFGCNVYAFNQIPRNTIFVLSNPELIGCLYYNVYDQAKETGLILKDGKGYSQITWEQDLCPESQLDHRI